MAAKKLTLNMALLAIIAILLVIIAAVTITAFAGGKMTSAQDGAPPTATPAETQAGKPAAGDTSDVRMWTGLGRLRCPLKPAHGETSAPTAVLTITFYYNRADAAFTYELARSNARFREETRALFASIDRNSDLLSNEDALKKTLERRFNAPLRLGKTGTLIFSDFVIID
ncbi:MAG: hypothetical protein LBG72_01395 [Spirochaetaceae bacterium]|nr:hypothetical protein [Spirochaetaceae bacterium]